MSAPKDVTSIDVSMIIDAAYDYKYLLSRGYNQRYALDVITLRYSLNRKERLLIYRCIHSTKYVMDALSKTTCNFRDGILVIDFYNILLTTLCLLEENCDIYLCDDCIVRDLRGSKIRSQDYRYMLKAYDLIVDTIFSLKPLKIIVIADKNVSHSSIQVEQFNRYIRDGGLKGYSILSSTPDKDSIEISKKENAIIASSDSIIVEKAYKVFPLTSIILSKLNRHPLINFAELFGISCSNCYDYSMQTVDEKYECYC